MVPRGSEEQGQPVPKILHVGTAQVRREWEANASHELARRLVAERLGVKPCRCLGPSALNRTLIMIPCLRARRRWSEQTGEYYLHYFAPEQPDLNWELEEVRDAVFQEAIIYWLDRGVDGFRIDTSDMYS